jgi:hypothetical protein
MVVSAISAAARIVRCVRMPFSVRNIHGITRHSRRVSACTRAESAGISTRLLPCVPLSRPLDWRRAYHDLTSTGQRTRRMAPRIHVDHARVPAVRLSKHRATVSVAPTLRYAALQLGDFGHGEVAERQVRRRGHIGDVAAQTRRRQSERGAVIEPLVLQREIEAIDLL